MSRTATVAQVRPIPHVIKPNYVSGVISGKPFTFDSTHPTFKLMVAALQKGNWAQVPKLIITAEAIANQMGGRSVTVKAGGVCYKGRAIDSSLTKRIVDMMKEGKPVAKMLKFMENLYKNPSPVAIGELFDWLQRCNLPITDDGCFLAYKVVNANFTDCHTGKIDNSPGQDVRMPRRLVDDNRRNHCSTGLHFCSRTYIPNFRSGGNRLMAVKINPKDVVSIPDDYSYAKGRTWRYEVIEEIHDDVSENDATMMQTSIVMLAKDRQGLLKLILAHPHIKRAIKNKKLAKTTIVKQTHARLKQMAAKLPIQDAVTKVTKPLAKAIAPPDQAKVLVNPMKSAREAAGLTIGQLVPELGIGYKAIWALEKSDNPRQDSIDKYLEAVGKLSNLGSMSRSAVSSPVTAKADVTKAAAAKVSTAIDNEISTYEEETDEYDDDGESDPDDDEDIDNGNY